MFILILLHLQKEQSSFLWSRTWQGALKTMTNLHLYGLILNLFLWYVNYIWEHSCDTSPYYLLTPPTQSSPLLSPLSHSTAMTICYYIIPTFIIFLSVSISCIIALLICFPFFRCVNTGRNLTK